MDEWRGCTRCKLGQDRKVVGGHMIFGEGALNSVMFLYDAPGEEEEREGYAFTGPGGAYVLKIIESSFGGVDSVYLTNTVCCRSWSLSMDENGEPRVDRYGRHRRVPGEIPTDCVKACRARLMEEIYLVDPLLIVALGGTAVESLVGKPVAVTNLNGTVLNVKVPGATHIPSRTPKGKWGRMVGKKGEREMIFPTEQNMVDYNVVVTIHPNYVLQNEQDLRLKSPVDAFAKAMVVARDIYRMHLEAMNDG